MSTIIRATDRNRGTHGVAFNFDDMAGRANEYLDQVRSEAGKIVAQAKREAAGIRTRAEQEGRQAAMAAVESMVSKQLGTVLPALRKVVEDVSHAKHTWLRHWEAAGVHVAAAIAQRIIRRELPQHPEITLTLVREALELASGNTRLRIHLNPDDLKAVGEQVQMIADELSNLSATELVADDKVSVGGCRVETDFGIVDHQIESQLKRIEEELT